MQGKVLLIRPQNIYHYNNYPPLGLIALATQLKVNGYEVKIINCALEKNPLDATKRELDNVLFVGISILTAEVMDAFRIVEYIRKHSDIPILVGGVHCTLFPEQMANCSYIDYVVVGEGEEHILHIAKMIKNKQRQKNKIFQKQILDMERLPLSEYSLDNNIKQFIGSYLTDKLEEIVKRPMRWLPYESSRGCPSQCTFCINTVVNNTCYRKKSAQKVLTEIEGVIKQYSLSHLKFIDDNFFVDINRVRTICEGIIEKRLSVTWDAECRCDYFNDRMLNDEVLKLLKLSGLVQLTLGVESGSAHTLGLMKKGITSEQAEYAINKCSKHGIIARSSFILEIPGENIDDIKQTVHFVNRLRKYPFFTCGVGTFRPYPRCELTRQLTEKRLLTQPLDFRGWANRDIIDMYTSAEYIRPWQVNGRYSESVAYYLNMESAVRLGNHQIKTTIDKIKNNIFVFLARLRNRLLFYNFPFEKKLYKRFLVNFYKKRQESEKTQEQ